MSLGLSHSLSRYKLKFSPEKVDTMIVQVGGPAHIIYAALSWIVVQHISVTVTITVFGSAS